MSKVDMEGNLCVICEHTKVSPKELFLREVKKIGDIGKNPWLVRMVKQMFEDSYLFHKWTAHDMIGKRYNPDFVRAFILEVNAMHDSGALDKEWNSMAIAVGPLQEHLKNVPILLDTCQDGVTSIKGIVHMIDGVCGDARKVRVIERSNGKVMVFVEYSYYCEGDMLPISHKDKHHVIPLEGERFEGVINTTAMSTKGNIVHIAALDNGQHVVYVDGRTMYRFNFTAHTYEVSNLIETKETLNYIGF